nr:hypothetical protein [Streptococcus sp. S784/96/1]
MPQDHIVFTIEKVVNALEDSHFHAFYHDFGRLLITLKSSGCSAICLLTRYLLWAKDRKNDD